MKQPKITKADFVTKLVQDPQAPPKTKFLSGYIGDAPDKDQIRLYLDVELKNFLDIPVGSILHVMDMPKEQSPLGGSYLWIADQSEMFDNESADAGQNSETELFKFAMKAMPAAAQEKGNMPQGSLFGCPPSPTVTKSYQSCPTTQYPGCPPHQTQIPICPPPVNTQFCPQPSHNFCAMPEGYYGAIPQGSVWCPHPHQTQSYQSCPPTQYPGCHPPLTVDCPPTPVVACSTMTPNQCPSQFGFCTR